MIKTKENALEFLRTHKEFSDYDWTEGEFWFRYDGVQDCVCDGIIIKGHDYTINHEKDGIIGVSEKEAVNYVFRNRKRLNKIK